MAEFNRDCRLRLHAVHCRCGSACNGFKPRWFGASRMEPLHGECGFRLIYPVAVLTLVAVPTKEAA